MTEYKNKRIRKAKIRRNVFVTICLIVFFSLIGMVFHLFVAIRPEKKDFNLPEYVDVQNIPVGRARKGFKLKEVKSIVIHYVGNPNTSAQNNRDYFAKPTTTVCSHFVIGLEGEVIQCVPLDERSAASNHRNKDSISIEVCHPDESGKFNNKTYSSLVKLTAFLCKNFDLGADDVIRHYDVTGKLCPLYYTQNPDEWETFKSEVKEQISDVK